MNAMPDPGAARQNAKEAKSAAEAEERETKAEAKRREAWDEYIEGIDHETLTGPLLPGCAGMLPQEGHRFGAVVERETAMMRFRRFCEKLREGGLELHEIMPVLRLVPPEADGLRICDLLYLETGGQGVKSVWPGIVDRSALAPAEDEGPSP